jgi:hypothetical protein
VRRAFHGITALAAAACFGGVVLATQSLGPPVASASTPADCAVPNPPNELTLAGGTPQTAQLETGFASPLEVALANTDGCPVTGVAGTPITFTAPASGASGSFEASGSGTLTVGADAQGDAQAAAFTADDTPGGYTVTAASAYGTVSFALTNTAAGIPAAIAALPPAGGSAVVGTRYREPLSVRVTDADGSPVIGVTVTFSLGAAGSGGGAAAGASFAGGSTQAGEATDSAGVATSPALTADDTPGTFTATASVAHVTDPAGFRLRNLAAGALRLARLGRRRRTARVDTSYGRPLRARVTAANGAPVTGATVTFTLGSAASGGGGGASAASAASASFATGTAQATVTTGSNGIASSPRFAAGDVAGTLTATVTLQGTGDATRFRLSNAAAAPAEISAGVAASESTTVGTTFAIPLAVTVTDAYGNRVPGAPVTFTAPAGGASGSFDGRRSVTVRTDPRGVAVAPPFPAGELAGGYAVEATTGHARAAAFALVNRPR